MCVIVRGRGVCGCVCVWVCFTAQVCVCVLQLRCVCVLQLRCVCVTAQVCVCVCVLQLRCGLGDEAKESLEAVQSEKHQPAGENLPESAEWED